jgi:hypothetical protein
VAWKKQYGCPHSEQVHWPGLIHINELQRLIGPPIFQFAAFGFDLSVSRIVAIARNQELSAQHAVDIKSN